MREAVEERRCHLRIAEHARPFAESEIGGDQDRSALVEAADEVEEKLPAGLGEGQIAEFVEDDEVLAGEIVGDPALPPGARLGLEPIDEIDGGEEAAARSRPDAASRDGESRAITAGRRPMKTTSAPLGKPCARRNGSTRPVSKPPVSPLRNSVA